MYVAIDVQFLTIINYITIYTWVVRMMTFIKQQHPLTQFNKENLVTRTIMDFIVIIPLFTYFSFFMANEFMIRFDSGNFKNYSYFDSFTLCVTLKSIICFSFTFSWKWKWPWLELYLLEVSKHKNDNIACYLVLNYCKFSFLAIILIAWGHTNLIHHYITILNSR